jgi:hypothetical protein
MTTWYNACDIKPVEREEVIIEVIPLVKAIKDASFDNLCKFFDENEDLDYDESMEKVMREFDVGEKTANRFINFYTTLGN